VSLYRGHAIAGVAAYAAFSLGYLAFSAFKPVRLPIPLLPSDLKSALICAILAFLSSIFPDVDTKSKAQMLFYRIVALFILALIASGSFKTAALVGLFAMTPLLGGHRGWTHSPMAALAIPSLFTLIPILKEGKPTLEGLPFSTASFIGYISHLWLDGLLFRRGKRKRG